MKLRWPIRAKMYWCQTCNLPLAVKNCPKCGAGAKRLELNEPGDARPALPRDYELLLEALKFELKGSYEKGFIALIGRSPALLNKVPYFDEMREVYVDGQKIGRLYFDPFFKKWRFRPSKTGAMKILEVAPDVVERTVVTKKKLLPPKTFTIGKNVEKNKMIFLVRENGEPVGLAYSLGDGRARVHSWWGDGKLPEPPTVRTTLDDVIKAHREHLKVLEAKAVKTLAVYAERLDAPVVVSFSGGKDSHVALVLSLKTGLEPQVLFNDTGLELPETLETVERVVKKTGLEIIVARPEADFWKAIEVFGPPARDYRWCCKICKLAPLAKTVKSKWLNGALNVVAQRAYESLDRARGSIAWRLRWAPYVLNVSPIMYWTQFEEWLYIMSERIEVNPLYYKGYERIGCFMCPASYLAEFELVSKTHPDLWGRWVKTLKRWAERLGLPEEYVDYGLWRWYSPTGHRDSLAKKLRLTHVFENWERLCKARTRLVKEVERGEKYFRVDMIEPVDTEALNNQLAILKPSDLSFSKDFLEARWSFAHLKVERSKVIAEYENSLGLEIALDSIKSYYRWRSCVGCLSCETNCPTGAIKVERAEERSHPKIDPSKCVGCRLCLRNCPVAEVFGEHVLAPLLLGDLYAWLRASREAHEDVLERARAMLTSQLPKKLTKLNEVPEGLADFFSST
ncbi:MAG: phosphoadenosine phosphosulfate reductase family protein [Acidilobaceae archaeon]